MCVDIIERPNLAEILLWGIHIIFLPLPVASCTACDVRCIVWLICWTLCAATFDWQKCLWRQPVCTYQGPCSYFWWITLAHANIKCCVNARLHGCIWIKPKPHVQDDDRFAKKVIRRSWTRCQAIWCWWNYGYTALCNVAKIGSLESRGLSFLSIEHPFWDHFAINPYCIFLHHIAQCSFEKRTKLVASQAFSGHTTGWGREAKNDSWISWSKRNIVVLGPESNPRWMSTPGFWFLCGTIWTSPCLYSVDI